MYVHLITFIGSLNIIYILIESRPNMCLGDTGNTLIGGRAGARIKRLFSDWQSETHLIAVS